MRITTSISNINQIPTRSHHDLQHLTDGNDHTMYALSDAVQNAKGIQTGLDADKPSSLTIPTLYLASDTKKLYFYRGIGATLVQSNQPAALDTITLTINGTGVVLTIVSTIGSTPGNVLRGANAAATQANVLALLQAPGTTTSTGVALSAPNQALINLLKYESSGTNILMMTLGSTLTTLTGASTTSGNTFTAFGTSLVRIDPALFSDGGAQGDILYDNGSGLVRLAAGTSGQFLKTLGASANPAWGTVAAKTYVWWFAGQTYGGGTNGDILIPGLNGKYTGSMNGKGFFMPTNGNITDIVGIDANANPYANSGSIACNQNDYLWFQYDNTAGGSNLKYRIYKNGSDTGLFINGNMGQMIYLGMAISPTS